MFRFAALLLLTGCLPALDDDCRDDGDCPAATPVCLGSGVCVSETGEDAPDGAPPDADLDQAVPPAPDAVVVPADVAVPGRDGRPVPDALRCEVRAEACNGLDDDCDGRLDEAAPGLGLQRSCYDFPRHTLRVGECRPGFQECVDGGWGVCTGAVGPREHDACNGLDDDCDGTADEWVDPFCFDGAPPQVGVGECVGGARACEAGVASACVGQRPPAAEVCDQRDNDCDEVVDEGVPGGCACGPGDARGCYAGPPGTAGVGSCRAGIQGCLEEGVYGACQGQALPGGEICNALDDDCDGRIDEIAGQACTVGLGACRRAGQTVCEGRLRCSAVAGQPVAERCNDLDDDCDGRADEDLHVGEPCQVGVGACAAEGLVVCDGQGEPRCFGQAGAPLDEVCNGVDDDCDGDADEGLFVRCADFPLELDGVGLCHAGTRACDSDVCEGQRGPADEVCNAVDDDCDARVDEGFAVGEVCEVGAGACVAQSRRVCLEGESVCPINPMPGAAELCNDVDDDCDGDLDEEAPPQACYDFDAGAPGVGTCRAGQRVCGEVVCVGQIGPGAEVCNGADDDCDGATDEGAPVVACYAYAAETEGVGPCRAGQQVCGGPCVGERGPTPELCNGVDDDCDGDADEGFDVGARCTAGVGACSTHGIVVCALGQARCNADPPEAQPEACNEVDDDCDGRTDEGRLVTACYDFDEGRPGIGGCRAGERACGEFACVGQVGPSAEACNGFDDDCDGDVDEIECDCQDGTERVCYDPGGAPVAPCRRGVQGCDGGQWGPCVGQVVPQLELCDGIDNDCDGQVDDLEEVGGDCQVGAGACAVVGVVACANGVVFCDAVDVPLPQEEICDNADNDCDGAVDEAPAGGDPLCPPAPHAVGICEAGRCVRYECAPRWFDADDDPTNGCERGCPPLRAAEIIDDGGINNFLAIARNGDDQLALLVAGHAGTRLDIGPDGQSVVVHDQIHDSGQLAWVDGRWVIASRRAGRNWMFSLNAAGGGLLAKGPYNDAPVGPPGIGHFAPNFGVIVAWARDAWLRGEQRRPRLQPLRAAGLHLGRLQLGLLDPIRRRPGGRGFRRLQQRRRAGLRQRPGEQQLPDGHRPLAQRGERSRRRPPGLAPLRGPQRRPRVDGLGHRRPRAALGAHRQQRRRRPAAAAHLRRGPHPRRGLRLAGRHPHRGRPRRLLRRRRRRRRCAHRVPPRPRRGLPRRRAARRAGLEHRRRRLRRGLGQREQHPLRRHRMSLIR